MKKFACIVLAFAMLVTSATALAACKANDPGGGENPITDTAVTEVTLDKSTAIISVGGNVTLTATVRPADATNKNVTWTTSNAAAAQVTGGVVTGVSIGTATIRATADAKSATCYVTVMDTLTDQVKSLIQALPSVVTTDHRTQIEAARAAFEGLTDAQKALIPAELAKLTAAEAALLNATNDIGLALGFGGGDGSKAAPFVFTGIEQCDSFFGEDAGTAAKVATSFDPTKYYQVNFEETTDIAYLKKLGDADKMTAKGITAVLVKDKKYETATSLVMATAVSIKGNGATLSATKAGLYILHYYLVPHGDISLRDIKLTGDPTQIGCQALRVDRCDVNISMSFVTATHVDTGFNFRGGDNADTADKCHTVTVDMKNCTVNLKEDVSKPEDMRTKRTANYYAMNTFKLVDSTITATDCDFDGWAAINTHDTSTTFDFTGCKLTGTNDKTNPKYDGNNDFSVIVVDGNTFFQEGEPLTGKGNIFNFHGGSVNANRVANCWDEAYISLQYGAQENTLNFIGTNFTKNGGFYNPTFADILAPTNGEDNHTSIIVNGVELLPEYTLEQTKEGNTYHVVVNGIAVKITYFFVKKDGTLLEQNNTGAYQDASGVAKYCYLTMVSGDFTVQIAALDLTANAAADAVTA